MNDKYQKRFLVQGREDNQHFSNCFLNSTMTDGRLMAINDKYLALAFLGKGNIKLLDSSQPINLKNNYSIIKLEDSNILDMEFSPFDSNILCFCDENNYVFLSKINYKSANDIEFNSTFYQGHEKKVNFINFNPIASNLMVSGTTYGDIHIWESKECKTYMQFKLAYNPTSILWSPNGDLIGVTTKNRILTVYEPRNRNMIFQEQISQNSLISRFAWLDNNMVATVGINKENKKELSLLDIRKSNKKQNNSIAFSTIEINQYNQYNSVTIPFVNPELKLIYCVGKEESTITIFDYCTGSLKKNNVFKSFEPNDFCVLLNRRYLNKSKMEVDRFARCTKRRKIYYVSFYLLPGQNFDGILYPSKEFTKPQMDSNEWINGKKFEKNPPRIYHKRQFQNNELKYYKQLDTSANKPLNKLVNQKKEVENSKSKNNGSNLSQQKDYEYLYKELEKEHISLKSKFSDLQNSLKKNENLNLSEKLKISEEQINSIKLEINKYKELIQEKDKTIQGLKNDYKQKEEKALKNIEELNSQINEQNSLLKSKEKEITNYKNSIKEKDNIIKNYELKLRIESENKLNIEEIKLEYEKKISLLKEQLKKNYEGEMSKKIEVIKNQYRENMDQELKNIRKNLIKKVGNNLKELKEKYKNIYRTKEEEINKMFDEKIKLIKEELNLNIKGNKKYYNKIEEEHIKLKNEISRFPFTLLENEYIIILLIMTKDEKLMFPTICKNTDKFKKIKEIFLKEFPEYSETKGKFYYHNNNVLKDDESLEECKIKTNEIIIFEYE